MDAPEDAGGRASPSDARRPHRLRRLTLTLALALIGAGVVATLSHAQVRRTGTNGVPLNGFVGTIAGAHTICQDRERIPAGTSAIRIGLTAFSQSAPPPPVHVVVASGGVTRASGSTGARWAGPFQLAVPLRPRPLRELEGSVCMRTPAGRQQYALVGVGAVPGFSATADGQSLPGRVHVEYLAPGTRTWWSYLPTLGARIGHGHAWSGPSVALLLALLMLTPIALAAWQLVRGAERR
ncbi:MAG TPA: hypothetical protein VN635_15135 [Conexibacter sp.]|nr:hypothetical protein [Conexibacter sp.]